MANVQLIASVDLILYDYTFAFGDENKVGRLLRMYKKKEGVNYLELSVN